MKTLSPFNVRTPEMIAFTATQAEYSDFIWNIASDEPVFSGYNVPDDLPELTDEERALVLRAKPEVLQGIRLDSSVIDQIHEAIKRQVFADVRAECDRLTVQKEQIL